MDEPTYEKTLRLLKKVTEKFERETEKGRTVIWIDKKLVDWLDLQVETGKFRDRSSALEEIIRRNRDISRF